MAQGGYMALGYKTGGKIAKYSIIEFVCEYCGCKFTSRAAHKNYSPKFCSQECWSKRKIAEETLKRQSQAKKGKAPWNLGIPMWKNKEHPRGTLGKKINKPLATEETKRKLSISHKGKKYPASTGEYHWNWCGGITSENDKVRRSAEYKNWRLAVFTRDNFTCQICGKHSGHLHADHIVPFSINTNKRFDVDNGRTLCAKCHRQTDTYGGKMLSYGHSRDN